MTANHGGGDYVAEGPAVPEIEGVTTADMLAGYPFADPTEPEQEWVERVADLQARARRAEALNAAYERDLARVTAERDEWEAESKAGTEEIKAWVHDNRTVFRPALNQARDIAAGYLCELAEVRRVVREFFDSTEAGWWRMPGDVDNWPEWDALCRVAADDQTPEGDEGLEGRTEVPVCSRCGARDRDRAEVSTWESTEPQYVWGPCKACHE